MPGFGAYMLAGAAKGAGQGLIAQAQRAREDALLNLERGWQLEDAARTRGYTLQDRALERSREMEAHGRVTNLFDSLYGRNGSESDGSFDALNSEGYGGRGQFGQDRLDDFTRAHGIGRITVEQMLAMPKGEKEKFQIGLEQWHWSDIKSFVANAGLDRYIGTKINGVEVTESGILAAAHLGGKNGVKRYLESGGQYDPEDSNGTSLSDYMKRHAGLSTDLGEVYSVYTHPDTTSAQRSAIETAFAPKGFGAGLRPQEELSGEEWRDDGKGNEVLYGRTRQGKMVPYKDEDGQPFTRPSKPKDIELSAALELRLKRALTDPSGELDEDVLEVVKEEIERLMREEGMSEEEAEKSALDRMEFEQETVEDDGGFFGRATTTTVDGPFKGTFSDPKPKTPEPSGGLGRAPSSAPDAELVEPEQPGPRGLQPAARPPMPPEAAEGPTDPKLPTDPAGKPMTPEARLTVIQAARLAIAEGKPREAVFARLRSMGIDPAELDVTLSPDQKMKALQDAKDAVAKGADQKLVEQALAAMGIDPREAGLNGAL